MISFFLALLFTLQIQDAPISPFGSKEIDLTVEHDNEVEPTVDLSEIPGAFLERERVGETKTLLKIFVPVEKEGLHLLPALTIKAGDQQGTTKPETFTVTFQIPEEGLELKANIVGKEPFYPGQEIKALYTIYYKGKIELSKEELPLLHLEKMKKIGEMETEEREVGPYTLRTVSQRYLLTQPGKIEIPESVLQGKGEKGELLSKVFPFTLTVLSFPDSEKKLAFTKAEGVYHVKATLLSHEGEHLSFQLRFKGGEKGSSITLPNLFCQPGMSGFFKRGDPFIVKKVEEDEELFTVSLKVDSDLVTELPSLLFTSFDPKTGKYLSFETDPIPLQIEKETRVLEEKPALELKKISCTPPPKAPHLLFSFTLLLILPLFDRVVAFLRRGIPLTPKRALKRALSASGTERLQLIDFAVKERKDRGAIMEKALRFEWRESKEAMLQYIKKLMALFTLLLFLSSFTSSTTQLREALYAAAVKKAEAPYCKEAKVQLKEIANELGIKEPSIYPIPFLKNLSSWAVILFANLFIFLFRYSIRGRWAILSLLLFSLVLQLYLSSMAPKQAVVMRGTQVEGELLRSGEVVELLSIDEKRGALIERKGKAGYIPLESVKPIW